MIKLSKKSDQSQNIRVWTLEHNTIQEAVEAAQIDLSYNKPLAERDMVQLMEETNYGKATRFFSTSEGEVYYLFECDILILNKFSPFSSCISDSPFIPVTISESHIIFHADKAIPKRKDARKVIAREGMIVS